MAKHSVSEAARIAGKSRSTIHRHIKQGRISKEIGPDGEPLIDTSELSRVYGDVVQPTASSGQHMLHAETPLQDLETKAELLALRRENEALRDERDRWAAQAERLTLLLADQRPKQSRAPSLLARLFSR